MRVLVTGAAGFIGSHLCEALLARGHEVAGVDAFIPYYPRPIKEANLATARQHANFRFVELDLRTGRLEPTRHSARVVGMPSAAMASEHRNSRMDERSTARPSPRREYGVRPAPLICGL